MHPTKACKDCAFAVLFTPKGQIQSVLLCKRFPPSQNFMGATRDGKPWININHIQVQPTEWCHEFEKNTGDLFHESENSVTLGN